MLRGSAVSVERIEIERVRHGALHARADALVGGEHFAARGGTGAHPIRTAHADAAILPGPHGVDRFPWQLRDRPPEGLPPARSRRWRRWGIGRAADVVDGGLELFGSARAAAVRGV